MLLFSTAKISKVMNPFSLIAKFHLRLKLAKNLSKIATLQTFIFELIVVLSGNPTKMCHLHLDKILLYRVIKVSGNNVYYVTTKHIKKEYNESF